MTFDPDQTRDPRENAVGIIGKAAGGAKASNGPCDAYAASLADEKREAPVLPRAVR